MPIDVAVPESPGWWMRRLARDLEAAQPRLQLLDDHFRGDPPLPTGAEGSRDAYKAFQKKAHINLARLIVQAVRHRLTPIGFRTAADDDENGDEVAWRLWRTAGMTVRFSELARSMLALSVGYLIVGLDDQGAPLITAEDARQVTTAHDPVTDRAVAALKMFHDPIRSRDMAYLYLPGRLRVASRPVRRTREVSSAVRFNPGSWDWDEDLSADLPDGLEDVVPVVRVLNEDGVGEFEPHLADLDRINHMILQRMVIATMQAFRQRGIKGDLPETYPEGHPQAGQTIDYDGIFVADPGALWLIPGAAEIWESGQVDLSPILSAVKDDMRGLAAASTTPLTLFNPDSANQTAEGAVSAREDFHFKIEDRRDLADLAVADALALTFRMIGDQERQDRSRIEVIWAPVDRHSLQEKADAASKAVSTLPMRAILTEIWQLPPKDVDRYERLLLAQQAADPIVRAAQSLALG